MTSPEPPALPPPCPGSRGSVPVDEPEQPAAVPNIKTRLRKPNFIENSLLSWALGRASHRARLSLTVLA